jgi:hypothetical protein
MEDSNEDVYDDSSESLVEIHYDSGLRFFNDDSLIIKNEETPDIPFENFSEIIDDSLTMMDVD